MLRIRKVSTESARLQRSRFEFSSFLRDLRRSSIRSKLHPIRSWQLEFRLKLRISRLNGNASQSRRLRKLHGLGETQPWRSPRRNAEANSSPDEKQRRGRRSHASFAKFCVCEASAFQTCKQGVKLVFMTFSDPHSCPKSQSLPMKVCRLLVVGMVVCIASATANAETVFLEREADQDLPRANSVFEPLFAAL